MNVTPSDIF